jgi:hypothetical protein
MAEDRGLTKWPLDILFPFAAAAEDRPRTLHLLGDIATHPDRLDVERGEPHCR